MAAPPNITVYGPIHACGSPGFSDPRQKPCAACRRQRFNIHFHVLLFMERESFTDHANHLRIS